MTDLDLDAIEARAEAATEGPWEWRVSDDRRWAIVDTTSSNRDDSDRAIARFVDDDIAEFIAHARIDVPALVAVVRTLTAENERLRGKVERVEVSARHAHYMGNVMLPAFVLRALADPEK